MHLGCHIFEIRLPSRMEKLYAIPPQQDSGHSPRGPVRKAASQTGLLAWTFLPTLPVASGISPFLQSCETPYGNRTAWPSLARQPQAYRLRTRRFCEREVETENEPAGMDARGLNVRARAGRRCDLWMCLKWCPRRLQSASGNWCRCEYAAPSFACG